jgi:hypothetical protein
MQGPQTALFKDLLSVRIPPGVSAAIRNVAHRNYQTSSEWARRVLLRELQYEGVCVRNDGEEDVSAVEVFDPPRASRRTR